MNKLLILLSILGLFIPASAFAEGEPVGYQVVPDSFVCKPQPKQAVCKCKRGPRGFRGKDGARGPQGERGLQGEPGLPGPDGKQGRQGNRGFMGLRGKPGPGLKVGVGYFSSFLGSEENDYIYAHGPSLVLQTVSASVLEVALHPGHKRGVSLHVNKMFPAEGLDDLKFGPGLTLQGVGFAPGVETALVFMPSFELTYVNGPLRVSGGPVVGFADWEKADGFVVGVVGSASVGMEW